MTVATRFKSGRTGSGEAYVADHSGSPHARFMRLTAYALMPLGVMSAWWILGLAGKSLDGVRAEIGRPLPAHVLLAFGVVGMLHARKGMDDIIEDYVHDDALKAQALVANLWASRAIAALWAFAILLIAAPK
ncbi:MAG: succinate dehydrogenase, hydrophobic membrane anchor protein [Methylocystis sp.]|uniref:succinate dehydrogenase, hydrophobic membrane anchor protein n=1 Tax=Methylocystis sp. TaxID=1911079 RepID=UPI003964480E